MARKMSEELLDLVAERFRALGDPARLSILNMLRDGESSVTDIVQRTGLTQANVSKHLAILHTLGFVNRRKNGVYAFYSLADPEIFRLCDVMCGRIEKETKARLGAFGRR